MGRGHQGDWLRRVVLVGEASLSDWSERGVHLLAEHAGGAVLQGLPRTSQSQAVRPLAMPRCVSLRRSHA